MKTLYQILNIALGAFVGALFGSGIYRYYDFKTHPGFYVEWSAPWYTGLALQAAATIVIAAALLLAMRIIRKKAKE